MANYPPNGHEIPLAGNNRSLVHHYHLFVADMDDDAIVMAQHPPAAADFNGKVISPLPPTR